MSSLMPGNSGTGVVATGAADALRFWWLAVRPRTLTLSAVPVAVGSMLGWSHAGALAALPMLVALAAAVLIQVATNLHNDAADFERGADDPATRLGPPRVSAQGWLSASSVRRAAYSCFAAAALLGACLVWIGGALILAVGIASIAAGWAYSGGPRPIAYTAFGEIFVLVFFGLVAVSGSYYLQTGVIDASALFAGLLIGMPAAAVLSVNNLRDRVADHLAGRRTVAVLYGARTSCIVYSALLLAPFGMPALVEPALLHDAWGALTWLPLPWALWLASRLWRHPAGAGLNGLLAETARFQAGLAVALCVALWGVNSGA